MANHALGRLDAGVYQVVGNVEQAPDKCLVGRNAFGLKRFAVGGIRQPFSHKATLGTHRNDNCVLYLLSLHQAQNLGTIILKAI